MQTFVLQSNVWAKYTKKHLEFSLKYQQLNPTALILHAQMYSNNLSLKPLQNSPKSYKFSPNKNEEDFSHV